MDMYLIIKSILPFYRQFRSLTGKEDLEARSILLRLRLLRGTWRVGYCPGCFGQHALLDLDQRREWKGRKKILQHS